ncbi:MAG: IS4 family transposase [Lewinellaceae bacterium]|nr:IS4 family transposase [Lewinellaceae bacterium]
MAKKLRTPLAKIKASNAEKRHKARQKRLIKVGIKPLISLLPPELLEDLADSSGVDVQVKHLWGRLMALLMVYSIVMDRDDSFHTLADVYNSHSFQLFSGKGGHQTSHSSLASRFATIKAAYFEDLYNGFISNIQRKYGSRLDKEFGRLARFDSTMVCLSAALASSGTGMRVGAKPKKGKGKVQVKFTVGLQGLLPAHAQVHCDQAHLSEEKALKEAIDQADLNADDAVVFDMGMKSRKTFQTFQEQGRVFTTRLKNPRYRLVKVHKQIKGREHKNLEFLADEIVHLHKSGGDNILEVPFRLITAKVRTGEKANTTLYLLTNILDLNAGQIADIYLQRWDIEVFFRFLKQEIGLRSLLSFNENGIKAVFFLRLLTATMLRLFMWLNKRDGYKAAKFAFQDELLMEIARTLALHMATGTPLHTDSQEFRKILDG